MARLKALVVRGLGAVALLVDHAALSWTLRRRPSQVTVLDIDNTLADAWPTLLQRHRSERQRNRSMRPLPGMRAAAHDPAVARGEVVLYVSHRPLWLWPTTVAWLRANGFTASAATVLLVPSAASKVGLLARLADGRRHVTYWDDLSHSTELGRTGRYEQVIAEIASLPLTYHGLEDIAAVVSAAGGAGAHR